MRTCSQKPAGADTYFGSQQQFEAAQRKQQRVKILAYLNDATNGFHASLRDDIVAACRVDLERNELWPILPVRD